MAHLSEQVICVRVECERVRGWDHPERVELQVERSPAERKLSDVGPVEAVNLDRNKETGSARR